MFLQVQERGVLLCLLSFLVTVALIHQLTGIPRLGPLGDKLRHLTKHKDDYDLVFVGSSRIYRAIIPSIFDQELRASGYDVHSFNLGMSGMGAHEANAVLRRVLASRPEHLRFVVIELAAWDAEIRPENRFKRRMIFWHDHLETFSALRSTWLSELSPHRKLGSALGHLLHMGGRYTALGHGPDAIENLRCRASEADELAANKGFRPFSESAYGHPTTHPVRRLFLARLDQYEATVARLPTRHRQSVSLAHYNQQALEDQIAMLRAHGVEPIYLIPPSSQPAPVFRRLAVSRPDERFWFYNDPSLYPDLYRIEDRFDFEHLAQDAAERFTRLLAARFAATLAG